MKYPRYTNAGVLLSMIIDLILRTKIGRRIKNRMLEMVLEMDPEAPLRRAKF